MKRIILILAISLLSNFVLADDMSNYVKESRAVMKPFLKKLGAENKKAIMTGGPESAVKVCKEIAPEMTSDISRQTGWKISRVSLKVRNPLLGTPDAWEQKKLHEFSDRVANGEKPATMNAYEIVQEPAGKYFRFMKAIPLKPGCVACHGTTADIPENVRARLNAEYPYDQAIGYSIGQIRGAVSIKRPL